MGYPGDILSTRAVIKRGDYAIIPPEGLVRNVVPGLEDIEVSILASPKLGAGFVQYIATAQSGKGTRGAAFAREAGVEGFLYCVGGTGTVQINGETHALAEGRYAYAPPGVGLGFDNTGDTPLKLILYKQRHQPLEGHAPEPVFGDAGALAYRDYDGMANVHIKDLLPASLGYDMNFHILSFDPGGSHPFFETHVQEHGMYILGGEGAYFFGDDSWRLVKKGDFVWFGAFTLQGAYGVGREPFTYVYSKDCNRDVEI